MRMLSIAPVRRELVHGGQESVFVEVFRPRHVLGVRPTIFPARDTSAERAKEVANPDVELENRRTLDATALAIVARTSGGSALACEHQITRCRRREGRNRLVSIGFRAPLAGIRC